MEQTHQPSPTFVKCRISIISAPRRYCISEDKNVRLTFSPTPRIPLRSVFPPAHHRRPASSSHFYPPSPSYVPPHLYLPISPPHLFWCLAPSQTPDSLPCQWINRKALCHREPLHVPHPPLARSPRLPRLQTHILLRSLLFSPSPPLRHFSILLSPDHFFMRAPET